MNVVNVVIVNKVMFDVVNVMVMDYGFVNFDMGVVVISVV